MNCLNSGTICTTSSLDFVNTEIISDVNMYCARMKKVTGAKLSCSRVLFHLLIFF